MEGIVVFSILVAVFVLWRIFRGDRKMESKNTKIVIVGMERSAKYGRCPGSAHDAESMAQLLGGYGNVTVLRDGQARKSAVVSALEAALDSDLLIFFYSGHGGSERAKSDSGEKDGMDEYLCLYDGAMVDNEVWNIISRAKGRVLCIFDCCHSATMYQMVGNSSEDVVLEPKPFTMQVAMCPMALDRSVNMLVWSGCPDSDYSYGDANGGVLTNAILHAYSKDRTYDEVWHRASTEASSQNPVVTQIGSGFGGKVFR